MYFLITYSTEIANKRDIEMEMEEIKKWNEKY
jgi:hypothetical protein